MSDFDFLENEIKKILKKQQEKEKSQEIPVNLEIYAEVSKRHTEEINNWKLPDGVEMSRKSNSGACFFECDDESSKEDLIDFLDGRGIPWQEN